MSYFVRGSSQQQHFCYHQYQKRERHETQHCHRNHTRRYTIRRRNTHTSPLGVPTRSTPHILAENKFLYSWIAEYPTPPAHLVPGHEGTRPRKRLFVDVPRAPPNLHANQRAPSGVNVVSTRDQIREPRDGESWGQAGRRRRRVRLDGKLGLANFCILFFFFGPKGSTTERKTRAPRARGDG